MAADEKIMTPKGQQKANNQSCNEENAFQA